MKRDRKLILLITGILFFVLVGFTTGYIYTAMSDQKDLEPDPQPNRGAQDSVPTRKSEAPEANKNVINILFLGIDRTGERNSWLGIYRTDTIALVRINLSDKKIKVLNIPRDTYTYVPVENKLDKINHAYAYGSLKSGSNGIQSSIEAINHFFNRNIAGHYFLMDMEPIPSIVDEIGGVKLDVEIDMKDHGANLSKGLQVLNGSQAFDYIHWRYSPGGDVDRIKRQQKFLSALYKQQRDSGKVLETLQIILKYKNNVQTDLTMPQMIRLAKFMSAVPDGNVEYYIIPGTGEMIDGISYWVIDKSKTDELLKEFFNNS